METLIDRAEAWDALAVGERDPAPSCTDAVTRTTGADLPGPARRLLDRAGTPTPRDAASVVLDMRGEFKLKRWMPFTARQILSPGRGFVWNATVGGRWLRFRGGDAYWRGEGSLEFALFGLIPLVRASGTDASRSAAGRLAAETIAWAPDSLVPSDRVVWRAIDDRSASVSQTLHDETVDGTVVVGPDGDVEELVVQRWGAPPGDELGLHPFGGAVTATTEFDGIRIASEGNAGWHWGTARQSDGEFFRYRVTHARRIAPVA